MNVRLKPAEEKITENDTFIAEALKSANVPTLMMAMVHVTGDMSLLDGPIKPRRVVNGDYESSLSSEEKAQVRAQALEVLKAYRDRGCTLPPPLSERQIHALMSFMMGEDVPEEYVPMMAEELALDGIDHRAFQWDKPIPSDQKQNFKVLIIGAGMSGLLAAIRLEEAGIPYVIVEKNEAVGGTWFENSYPGCRVDSPNHFYSFSFEPNHGWPEFFSRRDELFAYFNRCSDKFGIRPHIRFSTEVVTARYSEDEQLWNVTTRTRNGKEESLKVNAIVTAVGQLNRSKLPDIAGRDSFAGPSWHSANWKHEYDLKGKTVAVIGTGASAFQIVPEVAKVAGQLKVFQRSAPWMFPNSQYHALVSEGKRWLLTHVPYYARWYRFLLFYASSDALLPACTIDPEWPHQDRSISKLNDRIRENLVDNYKLQVGDNPELLEKVIPKYPPFVKRILVDNGSWLSALRRDNVELITDEIREIVRDGIIDANGNHHRVDIIVYATGFHANRFLWPMEIVGKGGANLRETWGDEPHAYLGITVPKFPNLFLLYGPSTNLAHGGSIIFHSECQVRYVMECVKAIVERGAAVMECKDAPFRRYVEEYARVCAGMVWAHPGTRNWYKNARGVVVNTSPWRLVDYWKWMRQPDLADYELR
ncbi:MAG TPA: NAD(P)/FAD-dependent oxidoreductase [Candidatus Binataceae bacterium]|jgi:4-hydroxyacetophenone monooxygenase|nr:NAD(P)/FAD-dependent oxidoreductase [Candidatus Binataceae bacterium]